MKKTLLLCSFMLSFFSYAQTNYEIAGVYLRKAQENYNNLKIDASLSDYNKALKYLDTVTRAEVAKLGSLIHYEHKNFKEAKRFAKKYFSLTKNRTSEEFEEFLELYVDMEEKITKEAEEARRIAEEKLKKERELRRIDSLKKVWFDKEKSLTISINNLQDFDSNGLALFKKEGRYGVIDDAGNILIKPLGYSEAFSFDGYFLFMDKPNNPTKIFCYNSSKKEGYTLPKLSKVSPRSTNYGKVMLPRANSRLVMYPDNTSKVLVFDLKEEKYVNISNIKELFKELKKNDVIDRFKEDDLEIKIDGEWYKFGGHLGGNIYPIFTEENNSLYGYLFSKENKILKEEEYPNIGILYNGKLQVVKDESVFWINSSGSKSDAPKNESGKYEGETKVKKIKEGRYQFFKTLNGEKYQINKKDKLETMASFLRKNNVKIK